MAVRWRHCISATVALRQLLPVLLPAPGAPGRNPPATLLASEGWADAACQRGLGPVFSVFFRQGGLWEVLPARTQDLLSEAYRTNLARWLVREQVIADLLNRFRRLGRTPVVLKGLAFATELYPEPAARLAGDIDLLIAPAWKEEIHQGLEQAGFRLISPSVRPPGWRKAMLRRVGRWLGRSSQAPSPPGGEDDSEAVYLAPVGGEDILVEIHHKLINLRAGGGKATVFRTREDQLPPTRLIHSPAVGEMRVLDPASAFLHALRHIALHHRLIGFRWHHDLALMLVHWNGRLDPARLRETCRALNSEKIFDVELAILADLFGPRVVPADAAGGWQPQELPWEFPLYRHVARGGTRTPWREIVRTLLAPGLREQFQTLS